MSLPEVIPLFPLPNVVLFPGMPLPLHVFEPRYRAMTRDALRGARLIGMVLLRGDWQAAYYEKAPIFATGTVGQMVHLEELPDGRFNTVLRGVRTFTIVDEIDAGHLYREARVAWRDEVDAPLPTARREALIGLVHRYLERLGRKPTSPAALDRDVDGAAFVNFFAQHLDLEPVEKQALLEEASTLARAARLMDVLEFRLQELARPAPGQHGRPH
jgi:Lon protease-like protein